MNDFRYSVLLPVYHGDYPEYLKTAIESMTAQTLRPEEILIAVDGPISDELREVIEGFRRSDEALFTVIYYPENRGLGTLLRDALPMCRNEFVARMDADDYSVPTRIEKQSEVFRKYPTLSAVGCNVDEFTEDISRPVAHVVLPESPEECLKFARRRNPMRHPALLYKKSDVIAAGNYSGKFFRLEDYDLIMRMIHNNLKAGLYNIQEVLYFVRVSENFFARRGGFEYMLAVVKLKTYFLRNGFISLNDYIISCFGHAFVNIMPGYFREWFYKKFLRR